jgi:hypothetical protein
LIVSEGATRYWNEPVLAPTEVKRQHYVPKLYLRAFADPSDQVRVVDLDEGKEYRTSLDNVALQGRFNDVQLGGIVVSNEGWLSELEGQAAPLLKRLIDDPAQITALTDIEQMQLARFLASMRFRVPAFREMVEALSADMVSFAKGVAKDMVTNKHDPETASRIWAEWEKHPEEWWLGQSEALNTAALAASMLREVQGYANLLFAMPWRVGRVPASSRLYTSDNPVHGYLRPVRPWWEHGAFASLTYYIPLSRSVLLKIDHLPARGDQPIDAPGARAHKDFSGWHVGMALCIASAHATRFVYGDGLVVGRDSAVRDLKTYSQRALAVAKWLGHSDQPPPLEWGVR